MRAGNSATTSCSVFPKNSELGTREHIKLSAKELVDFKGKLKCRKPPNKQQKPAWAWDALKVHTSFQPLK